MRSGLGGCQQAGAVIAGWCLLRLSTLPRLAPDRAASRQRGSVPACSAPPPPSPPGSPCWVGGGGPGLFPNHVYSLVAPSSDSPLHLDRGNQPKVTASFFAAVQPYSQTFLPFTRISKIFSINVLSASPGGCGWAFLPAPLVSFNPFHSLADRSPRILPAMSFAMCRLPSTSLTCALAAFPWLSAYFDKWICSSVLSKLATICISLDLRRLKHALRDWIEYLMILDDLSSLRREGRLRTAFFLPFSVCLIWLWWRWMANGLQTALSP